jgi:hypothetical protein
MCCSLSSDSQMTPDQILCMLESRTITRVIRIVKSGLSSYNSRGGEKAEKSRRNYFNNKSNNICLLVLGRDL